MAIGFLLLRSKRFGWAGWRHRARKVDSARSAIEFYERLTRILAERGITRTPDQTPLEFATSAGSSEVMTITSAYNRVRFGAQQLSSSELRQIETLLQKAEGEVKHS